MSSRQIIAIVLMTAAQSVAGSSVCPSAEPVKVRDRLWVWAHCESVYNGTFGLPGTSRITPIEGAVYLNVPNLIFVRYLGKPAPPWDQYVIPFRAMDRVFLSATGANGDTSVTEREYVLDLAKKMPNVVGLFLDDFFRAQRVTPGTAARPSLKGALSTEELRQLRQRLVVGTRRLDLGVTLYTHQFSPEITPYLELCDVVSVWTWKGDDVSRLEGNMQRFWKMSPRSRTLLGLYMWDFGTKKPLPLSAMQHQCDLGLKWLREGRVEGLILLGTNVCDLNLETVEWTRAWVARIGDEPLAK